jgi:hypothetical protein
MTSQARCAAGAATTTYTRTSKPNDTSGHVGLRDGAHASSAAALRGTCAARGHRPTLCRRAPSLRRAGSRSGRRALAATSQDRCEIFPDVPTFVEQGFADTVANQWAGTLAPAGTASAIIAKLSAAFNAALSDADVRRRLAQAGVTPLPEQPRGIRPLPQGGDGALGKARPRQGHQRRIGAEIQLITEVRG